MNYLGIRFHQITMIKLSTVICCLTLVMASCQQSSEEHQFTNALINETSPYLLQHAHNPVNWNPWNEATLKQAAEENKMIIISVGYSSCHWCHVMEHESFEDTLVSNLMNENFINIKVDREERPDVDDVYMTACQMSTGEGCGWPLNAFALPDGRPVWAGTYFPKKNWIAILEYFIELYKEDRTKLEDYATQLTQGLNQLDDFEFSDEASTFSMSELEGLKALMLNQIDKVKGGRKGAPKFPMPNNYEFLLAYGHLFEDEESLNAVTTTLNQMAWGGIYDQLGGGFSRYSTDANWQVPHFEKMLYDNGQLVSLYAKAFQKTGNNMYQKVVDQTLAFVERELTSPEGGFYSSLDADSEGEEGKFYVWQYEEIEQLLKDPVLVETFCAYYQVSPKGNWEETNVLHAIGDLTEFAQEKGWEVEAMQQQFTKARKILFDARSKRIRPGLDDKVLTSWNALMLKGYVDAYKATQNETYKEVAIKNGHFLLNNLVTNEGQVFRNYKNSQATISGFLDDYALLADAMLALYSITFEESWLQKGRLVLDHAIEHFNNAESPFFYFTSAQDAPLIARKTKVDDNVIPSSNSIMARILLQYSTLFDVPEYTEISRKMLAALKSQILETESPSYYSNWSQLWLTFTQTPFEVAIVGPEYESRRKALMAAYLPNTIFLGGESEGSLPLLKDKLQAGETMIYVCQNKVCKLPVTEIKQAFEQLKN